MLLAGTATFALGGIEVVPEIDGNSAVAAVALLSGGLLVIRARRKK
jgi:LPXTG-motif cell wall-anchored protein